MNRTLILALFMALLILIISVILKVRDNQKKAAKREKIRQTIERQENEERSRIQHNLKSVQYNSAPTSREELYEVPQWTLDPPQQEEPFKANDSNNPAPTEIHRPPQAEWTLAFLMSLEWKRFEDLCRALLAIHYPQVSVSRIGADGGIDIIIQNDQGKITHIGQCKAWKQKINVKLIRELYGVMASDGIEHGIYLSTSSYTSDAIAFCENKNIQLITGQQLIERIHRLSETQQSELLDIASQGDYQTPTCPRCNSKMIKRTNRKDNSSFWGCRNYPRCKNVLQVRKAS